MRKNFLIAIALLVAPVAAHGVAPTVVLPTPPLPSEWSAITIPLVSLGIDPATVTVVGGLRGEVYRDGGEFYYVPDRAEFARTDFDLLWVRTLRGETLVNVAVVRAESDLVRDLVARAGDTAVPDPGWTMDDTVRWDPAAGAYVVDGKGEAGFDFLRDDVAVRTFTLGAKGAQSGSGSSMTLRPPPPGSPFGAPAPLLIYRGGAGGDVVDLWLHPSGGGHQIGVSMVSAAGVAARATVPVPQTGELVIDLGLLDGEAMLTLTTPDNETYHRVAAPLGFSMDRTWHRFGNLEGSGQDTMVVDDLRAVRSSMDLSRQVVVVDDFDGPGWAGVWTSPEVGAVKLVPASVLQPDREDGGVLVASLDQANLLGPDYLERRLEVPRVAMTCVIDLDLSSLSGLDSGVDGAAVLAFRNDSWRHSSVGDLVRLLVRRNGGDREVRLVGSEGSQAGSPPAATPWIPLPGHAATLEVQWRRTTADESRLDLWIDGCGPDDDACASGWEVRSEDPDGLVTAVRLGILEGAATGGGEVRFDDVGCAGDSWVEPEG